MNDEMFAGFGEYVGAVDCGPTSYWDDAQQKCVPLSILQPPPVGPLPKCPPGHFYDPMKGTCVSSVPVTSGYYAGVEPPGPSVDCPPGLYWDPVRGYCLPTATQPLPPPVHHTASGYYAGQFLGRHCPDGLRWDENSQTCVLTGQSGHCPPGSAWDERSGTCASIIPPPPSATRGGYMAGGYTTAGDPCAGAEGATIASAFLNPIGAIFGAAATKDCKDRQHRGWHGHERRRAEELRRMGHRVGWDGEGWGWGRPEWEGWRHHRHHQWEGFVGAAVSSAAASPGATHEHVDDVHAAATMTGAATEGAHAATQQAPTAPHPDAATTAAHSARTAASHAQVATQTAAHPAAPGTRAAPAARTAAMHATRSADHARAAARAPTKHVAEAHAREATRHAHAAATHARYAHGAVRRGFGRPGFGGRGGRFFARPGFGYERFRGRGWGGAWRSWRGHEWGWAHPEWRMHGHPAWAQIAPAFMGWQAACALRNDWGICLKEILTSPDGYTTYRLTPAGVQEDIELEQDEQGANDAATAQGLQVPDADSGLLPGSERTADGSQAPPKDEETAKSQADASQAQDQGDADQSADDASADASDASDASDATDGGDTSTTGVYAGWGSGGGDPFTDPYGFFDPRMPSAWDTQYAYYPWYYEGRPPFVGIQSGPAIVGAQVGPQIEGDFGSTDPRVGIQSGPAIVGVQSGPAIVGVQSGPAIVGNGAFEDPRVGIMHGRTRGMMGGFYHSSPEREANIAQAQIEAMYPVLPDDGGGDGDAEEWQSPYPGYGFGGWGWGHGF